jgi:hypothetical protein
MSPPRLSGMMWSPDFDHGSGHLSVMSIHGPHDQHVSLCANAWARLRRSLARQRGGPCLLADGHAPQNRGVKQDSLARRAAAANPLRWGPPHRPDRPRTGDCSHRERVIDP